MSRLLRPTTSTETETETPLREPRTATVEDIEQLHRMYRAAPDPRSCERLVLHYRGLALAIARRMTRSDTDKEDIQQVAMLGLFQSVQRFEPDREVRFSTFAWRTIEGEIKRYFRDRMTLVHVPRPLQERSAAVGGAIEDLSHDLGRAPTTDEIAASLGIAVDDVIEALEVQRSSRPVSMDRHDDTDPTSTPVELGTIDTGFENSEQRGEIAAMVARLPERERSVFLLRFEGDLTQSEIARRIGISQMQVSRLLASSHARLREMLGVQSVA